MVSSNDPTVGLGKVPWSKFFALIELNGAERRAQLERLRKTDPRQAELLEELLAAHERADPLLDQPDALVADERSGATGSSDSDPQDPVPAPPPVLPFARLGDFELVERLGVGGMGEVYLGRRAVDAGEQKVAIKLVRVEQADSGQGSKNAEEVRQRFLKERAVLARLEHPGIARLIDYGEAPDGRPYAVLEFVDGEPIDVACRNRKLNLEQRLELFAQVCEAVHAAHRNLVVHRDIKPSNVLVSDRPRLLDFGIAKDLSEDGLTKTAQRRLTPSHASPEQLRGDPVTTASDIYSLGVLLCQLVTERLPYADTESGSRPVGAVASAILAGNCLRPSELVKESDRTSQIGEESQGSPAPFPASDLEGDVDAIVLRALALEPDRRYDSAMALATDVRRKLANLPITARPDSVVYRVSKLIQRRPLTFALGASAVVLLLLAVGLLTAQQHQLRESLAQAEAERRLALQQSQRAELTNRMLLGLIEEASPERALGESLTVLGALDRGTERLLSSEGQNPNDRVQLQLVLARVLANLGRHEKAKELIDGATVDLKRVDLAPSDLLSLRAALEHERGRYHYSQGQYADAIMAYDSILDLGVNSTLAGTAGMRRLMIAKATALLAIGEPEEAETLLTTVISEPLGSVELGSVGGLEGLRLLSEAQERLGRLYAESDDFYAALALQTEALENVRNAFGPNDPRALRLEYERALTLERQGEAFEAINGYKALVDRQTRVLGKDHSTTLRVKGRLAASLQRVDRFSEAEELYREVLLQSAPSSPQHSTLLINYGWVLHEQGKLRQAEESYGAAEQHLVASSAPEHRFITVLNNRGLLALDQGDPAEARSRLTRALDIARRLYGKEHSVVAFPLANLATAEFELGNFEVAESLHRQALGIRRAALGSQHPDLAHSLLGLARTLCAPRQGRAKHEVAQLAEEGRNLALEATDLRARAKSQYKTAIASVEVAACDLAGAGARGDGQPNRARDLLTEALPTVIAVRGEDDPRVQRIRALQAQVR